MRRQRAEPPCDTGERGATFREQRVARDAGLDQSDAQA
jgi:hypothetical protein